MRRRRCNKPRRRMLGLRIYELHQQGMDRTVWRQPNATIHLLVPGRPVSGSSLQHDGHLLYIQAAKQQRPRFKTHQPTIKKPSHLLFLGLLLLITHSPIFSTVFSSAWCLLILLHFSYIHSLRPGVTTFAYIPLSFTFTFTFSIPPKWSRLPSLLSSPVRLLLRILQTKRAV